MFTTTTEELPTVRELPVVTKSQAFCETSEDAREFLNRVMGCECVPYEASSGSTISFVIANTGKGYTLFFECEPVGDQKLENPYLRITNTDIVRNQVFDTAPYEYKQYRITFYEGVQARLDALEFAWLLSKYDLCVGAKSDHPPILFVHASSRAKLLKFAHEVNASAGPLVFKSIEGQSSNGYVEVEF